MLMLFNVMDMIQRNIDQSPEALVRIIGWLLAWQSLVLFQIMTMYN